MNELETRYARAFEGMGTPAGLARDAARMVAAHDVWGLGGLDALAPRLDRLDGAAIPQPQVTGGDTELSLDARGASLLHAGAMAMDLLETLIAGTLAPDTAAAPGDPDRPHDPDAGSTVHLSGCSDVDFAAGLSALAAERGLTVVIRARVGDRVICATACGGEVALVRGPAKPDSDPDDGTVDLIAGPRVAETTSRRRQADLRLTGNAVQARERDAIDQGIAVDPDNWQRVYALGARFLVRDEV
nr:DUF3726 domain-containing protein [Rhodovibrio sodomensis]